MSFRTDSLHDRLNQPQRHELMICIHGAGEAGVKDRFKAGLELCTKWNIKASRTGVHDFYKRYFYGWRVELGAWAARHAENMPEFEEQLKSVTRKKIFAEIADADVTTKDLFMARALQIEEEKIAQRDRLAENRVALESEKLKFVRDKFEFNAAEAALKHLDKLRAIRNDKSLTGDARLLRARQQLFGELPKE